MLTKKSNSTKHNKKHIKMIISEGQMEFIIGKKDYFHTKQSIQ